MKALLIVLSAVILFGPTPLPAVAGNITVTDVKELAGRWDGFERGSQVTTTLTVRDDGNYTAVGHGVNEGRMQLVEGRLLYDSALSSGTLRLEERDGKQFLILSGTRKRGGFPVTGEYVRMK